MRPDQDQDPDYSGSPYKSREALELFNHLSEAG